MCAPLFFVVSECQEINNSSLLLCISTPPSKYRSEIIVLRLLLIIKVPFSSPRLASLPFSKVLHLMVPIPRSSDARFPRIAEGPSLVPMADPFFFSRQLLSPFPVIGFRSIRMKSLLAFSVLPFLWCQRLSAFHRHPGCLFPPGERRRGFSEGWSP